MPLGIGGERGLNFMLIVQPKKGKINGENRKKIFFRVEPVILSLQSHTLAALASEKQKTK